MAEVYSTDFHKKPMHMRAFSLFVVVVFFLVCLLFRATWPQNGGFGTHLHHDATDEISKRTDRID